MLLAVTSMYLSEMTNFEFAAIESTTAKSLAFLACVAWEDVSSSVTFALKSARVSTSYFSTPLANSSSSSGKTCDLTELTVTSNLACFSS